MYHGLKDNMLIKKGAEASLFLERWHDRKVVMKQRFPKKYRLPEIDERIRNYRTIHESQLLHYAKEAGVSTPVIFLVNLKDSNIIMEFIEGRQVKQVLNKLSFKERKRLCKRIGEFIGRLHRRGVIHGDLTTSNMILTRNDNVVFVDFGLGEKSMELELRGVDLHLMKRAFQSTHFLHAEECFNAVLEGYANVIGDKVAQNISRKIIEIESRGRYISGRSRANDDLSSDK
jgi:TP53 regulating kinase-like protein